MEISVRTAAQHPYRSPLSSTHGPQLQQGAKESTDEQQEIRIRIVNNNS